MKTMALIVLLVLVALSGCCNNVPAEALPNQPVTKDHLPTCAMDMIKPYSVIGSNFFGSGDFDACFISRWDGILELRFAIDKTTVSVNINEQTVRPGDSADLVDNYDKVALWDKTCSDWTGKVMLHSDEPDWDVEVYATCRDDASHQIIANWWGHTYDGNN